MMRLLCFFLTFQLFGCYARIIQVDTMEEVKTYFDQADCDTLAIFDIDLVLIQPSDPAFQISNIKKYHLIAREIFQSLPSEKQDLFLTLVALTTQSILVDEQTPSFLEELAEKKIPTIALTSNLTGALGAIPNLECWKVESLRQLGIDFLQSAPIKENCIFYDLPSYRGYYSLYVEGVLFANGDVCPKGDVLVSYLSWGSVSPKHVIFIDDREGNLQNVEEALKAYDSSITFEGLLYKGASHYPSKEISAEAFQERWEELACQVKHLSSSALQCESPPAEQLKQI